TWAAARSTACFAISDESRAGRAPSCELDRILVVRRRRRVRYHRSPVPTPHLAITAGSAGLVPAWAVARTSACLAISDEGELDERLRGSSIGSSLSAGGDASAITGHPYQRHASRSPPAARALYPRGRWHVRVPVLLSPTKASWTSACARARSDPRCPPAATRPLSPGTRTNA